MKKHLPLLSVGAVLAAVLLVPGSAGASITGLPQINPNPAPALPAQAPAKANNSPFNAFAPTTGASWAGAFDLTVAPPDTDGAIGPSSYVEIINLQMAIYNRTGGTVAPQTPLQTLTGHQQFNLSDPMVLWDPNTQRFYFNVWDIAQATMVWGFSKTNSPTTATSANWCSYTQSFGYASTEAPDYPKLGQSQNFLMIGVNHYPNFSAAFSDRSDLLVVNKPQGSAPITTCPAATNFVSTKFTNLRNGNGSQAFTPVPAIEDDAFGNGYVVASNDIECPPTCGNGNLITVFTLRPSAANPNVASIVSTKSITVPTYTAPTPSGAPQPGTTNTLDVLDGRLEHAVAATDPTIGKVAIWTGHAVASAGGRTEFRWYEISPLPLSAPTVVQSGVVKSNELFIFNGAVAPDRIVNSGGSAHGDSIVIGYTESSSRVMPTDAMVSKIGSGAQSNPVVVHQATSADNDFTCTPKCRWGDYAGATSDPAASLTGTHGEVWMTNETVTSGNNTTWNWESRP